MCGHVQNVMRICTVISVHLTGFTVSLFISNLRTFHLCPLEFHGTFRPNATQAQQVLHTVRCNQCENKISPQMVIRFVFGLNKRRSFALKQYLLCACFFQISSNSVSFSVRVFFLLVHFEYIFLYLLCFSLVLCVCFSLHSVFFFSILHRNFDCKFAYSLYFCWKRCFQLTRKTREKR